MSYRGSIDQNRIKNAISSVHKGRTTDVRLLKAKSQRSEAKLFNKLREQEYLTGQHQEEKKKKHIEQELLALKKEKRTKMVRLFKGLALTATASLAVVAVLKRKDGRQALSRAVKAAAKINPRHLMNPEVMKASEVKAKSAAKKAARVARRTNA